MKRTFISFEFFFRVNAILTLMLSLITSVHILIDEKIVVSATRDGGLNNMEIKGDMMLRISDPSKAHIRIQSKLYDGEGIQYKTHPNVDKALFAQSSVIALKDPSRPFPTNQALGVLKWRVVSKDEGKMPLAGELDFLF